jgi:hypothetical protein
MVIYYLGEHYIEEKGGIMKKIIAFMLLLIFIMAITITAGCKKTESPVPAEQSAPQEPVQTPDEPAPIPEEPATK